MNFVAGTLLNLPFPQEDAMRPHRFWRAIVVAGLALATGPQALGQFSWDGDCSTLWYDCCLQGDEYVNNWSAQGDPGACPPLPGPADSVSLSGLVDSGGAQIGIAGMFQTGLFLCHAQGLSIFDGDIFTSGTIFEPSTFQLNGIVNLVDGATFDIGSFSTLDFRSGEIRPSGKPGQTLFISGFGTLTKTAEPAAHTRLMGMPFDNYGLISVPVGTLIVDAGGSNSGTIEVLGDGVLYFEGGTFDLGGEVRGDGLMHFHAGIANIIGDPGGAGNYHPTNTLIGGYPAVVNFETDTSVENLTLTSSGSIGGAGDLSIDDFTWISASTILPGGIVSVHDTAQFQTGQGPLVLHRDIELLGTANLNNVNMLLSNAEIRNYGELVLQGGSSSNIGHLECCVPNSNLKNFGTISKTGNEQSIISVGFSNVDGAINVQAGTLILDGQMASTGPITVNAGAELHMRTNQQSLSPKSSITGEGKVVFNGGVDYLEGEYAVATTVIFEPGAVQFQSDATTTTLNMVNGTLTGDGTFTVTGDLNFVWGGSIMSGTGMTKALGPVTMDYSGYLHRVLEIDNAKWKPVPPAAGGMMNIAPNSPGELRGIGTLDGNVSDNAGIAPGLPSKNQPIGSLTITGNLTQYSLPPGKLKIDINGAAHDELIVGGTATLSGNLIVSGSPTGGQSYTILTAQNIIGTFGQTTLPPGMTVSYTPTAVIVQAAPGELCSADIAPQPDGNGIVDVDDLLAVINAWGACEPEEYCAADIAPSADGNGVVDVDDLLTVINAWGVCE
jgi:hypothetical protein